MLEACGIAGNSGVSGGVGDSVPSRGVEASGLSLEGLPPSGASLVPSDFAVAFEAIVILDFAVAGFTAIGFVTALGGLVRAVADTVFAEFSTFSDSWSLGAASS